MAPGLEMITLSLDAMATRFELVLHGDDAVRLRAAGEQALQEIERLEGQLSFYRPDSQITWLNSRAADGAVKVDPRLFRLLQDCARLSNETDGAFDVTVGPLMRTWGFVGRNPCIPQPSELDAARRAVGMNNLEFNESDFTIRFRVRGVEIDLGGYGKGYAIERAADVLKESGITIALLHGGTSSVFAVGAPPHQKSWKVALSPPLVDVDEPIIVELNDAALSVSAAHGKSFSADGRTYGHVLDPRAGEPVSVAQAAAVTGPSPAVCEALSTALLVLGPVWLPEMESRFAGYKGFVAPA